MPRPRKCRRVCCMPRYNEFIPAVGEPTGTVVLTVDEYETIRLIDKEGMSQEECGEYMKVARTTVQQMYTEARQKLAQALVDGSRLYIRGGFFKLCEEGEAQRPGCCCRHGLCRREDKEETQ